MRVVFDTNTVVSALLFRGALEWLVEHWHSRASIPLVSRATANELLRVLAYPKFGLSDAKIEAIAARYLPFAERVEVEDDSAFALPKCRDPYRETNRHTYILVKTSDGWRAEENIHPAPRSSTPHLQRG